LPSRPRSNQKTLKEGEVVYRKRAGGSSGQNHKFFGAAWSEQRCARRKKGDDGQKKKWKGLKGRAQNTPKGKVVLYAREQNAKNPRG